MLDLDINIIAYIRGESPAIKVTLVTHIPGKLRNSYHDRLGKARLEIDIQRVTWVTFVFLAMV